MSIDLWLLKRHQWASGLVTAAPVALVLISSSPELMMSFTVRAVRWVSAASAPNWSVFSTYEQSHTQQDGHEGSGTQAHRQQDGLGRAAQHGASGPAGTHPHLQGAGAALGRVATVLHHHRQQVHILHSLLEVWAPAHNGCSVVCSGDIIPTLTLETRSASQTSGLKDGLISIINTSYTLCKHLDN